MELAELHQAGKLPLSPDISFLGWKAMRRRYSTLIDNILVS
jgi:hypothetical protein